MRLFWMTLGSAFLLLVLAVPTARADDSDKLRDLLKELRTALDAEQAKARPNADAVSFLQGLLTKYKADGDRGFGGDSSGGGPEREISGSMRRMVEGALADLELSEEDNQKTTDILLDWYQSRRVVYRAKDRAANGDIDADRDNRLKRLLGSKRSQTVIERANRSARYMFRDWGGGRGR